MRFIFVLTILGFCAYAGAQEFSYDFGPKLINAMIQHLDAEIERLDKDVSEIRQAMNLPVTKRKNSIAEIKKLLK